MTSVGWSLIGDIHFVEVFNFLILVNIFGVLIKILHYSARLKKAHLWMAQHVEKIKNDLAKTNSLKICVYFLYLSGVSMEDVRALVKMLQEVTV